MAEKKQDISKLIWLDLEMTGLDTARDEIIEIATVITDKELNIIATGPEIAIYQPDEVLEQMDKWNRTHHKKSGLIDRVKHSTVSLLEAEKQTLSFLKEHLSEKDSPLCGNSICQDRRFMARLMPTLEQFFHYRHIDVSTIKEIARRWRPDLYQSLKKDSAHRAIDDILESIEELRFYKEHFFRII